MLYKPKEERHVLGLPVPHYNDNNKIFSLGNAVIHLRIGLRNFREAVALGILLTVIIN
jgi:hypothetical protein